MQICMNAVSVSVCCASKFSFVRCWFIQFWVEARDWPAPSRTGGACDFDFDSCSDDGGRRKHVETVDENSSTNELPPDFTHDKMCKSRERWAPALKLNVKRQPVEKIIHLSPQHTNCAIMLFSLLESMHDCFTCFFGSTQITLGIWVWEKIEIERLQRQRIKAFLVKFLPFPFIILKINPHLTERKNFRFAPIIWNWSEYEI